MAPHSAMLVGGGWRLVLVALVSALFTSVVFGVVEGIEGDAHHRCLHSYSRVLQRTASAAVSLTVEAMPSDSVDPFPLSRDDKNRRGAQPSVVDGPNRSTELRNPATPEPGRVGQSSVPAHPHAPKFVSPLRIHFDVSHLHNSSDICSVRNQWRSDKLEGDVKCSEEDLLHAWKRRFIIKRLLPLLGSAVQQWLSVARTVKVGNCTEGTACEETPQTRLMIPQGVCGAAASVPLEHTLSGIRNADFVVYVMAAPLHDTATISSLRNGNTVNAASSRTVAWASYCAIDRHTGRPLVAMMNLVPSSLTFGSDSPVEEEIRVTTNSWTGALTHKIAQLFAHLPFSSTHNRRCHLPLHRKVHRANQVIDAYYTTWTTQHFRSLLHEMIHALGFAPPQLQQHSTLTQKMECGGSKDRNCTPKRRTSVAVVTAHAVRQAVQRWRNCYDVRAVPGATLEGGGALGTVGAHWERAEFRDDLMAGVLSPVAALSDVTLAFMNSLPFYQANVEFAETAWWGRGAGCNFGYGACTPLSRFAEFEDSFSSPDHLDLQTRVKYWCEPIPVGSPGHLQCTADRRSIGFCFARREALVAPPWAASGGRGSPAVENRGLSLLMEGCPIVEADANRACTLLSTSVTADVLQTASGYRADARRSEEGFYFGPYSRCFATSDLRRAVRAADPSPPGPALNVSPPQLDEHRDNSRDAGLTHTLTSARCLQTRCVNGGRSVEVRVGVEWLRCSEDGRAAVVPVGAGSGYHGYVGCEAATLYCADAPQLLRGRESVGVHATTATPSALSPLEMTSLLPMYRVAVTFFLSWELASPASPQRALRPDSPSPAERTVTPENHSFLSSLVGSDTALQVALNRDLSRQRGRHHLLPLGAGVNQGISGATRLRSVGVAVIPVYEKTDESSSPAALSHSWSALLSAEMEVAARSAGEAEAHTRAWLWGPQPKETVSEGSGASPRSAMDFRDVAQWLASVSCSLDAAATAKSQPSFLAVSRSSSASDPLRSSRKGKIFERNARAVDRETSPALPACRRGQQSASNMWNVGTNGYPYFSVLGPLDGASSFTEELALREAALVHLRFDLRRWSSTRSPLRPSSFSPTPFQKCNDDYPAMLTWLSEAGMLLSLLQDLGLLLGISPQWCRIRALQELPHQSRRSSSSLSANEASSSVADLDVVMVVSLPVFDASSTVHFRGSGTNRSAEQSSKEGPVTWSVAAAYAREVWRRRLSNAAEGVSACSPVLDGMNERWTEMFVARCGAIDGEAPFKVCLGAVRGVYAAHPGLFRSSFPASGDALHDGGCDPIASWWWHRPVISYAGVTVSLESAAYTSFFIFLLLAFFTWTRIRTS